MTLADAIRLLPPVAALVAALLVRRSHARLIEPQPWLDAGIVTATLLPLAALIACCWAGAAVAVALGRRVSSRQQPGAGAT